MESLAAALPSFTRVCSDNPKPTLDHLILCCLWGNRSDLSLSSGAVDAKLAVGSEGRLLVNHVWELENHLRRQAKDAVISLVLDNCGAELLADLRLALFLSERFKVMLHVKSHPVFVSDATSRNVEQHLVRMEASIAMNIRKQMTEERITIIVDNFYTSPCEFLRAPLSLKEIYARSCVIILKGDANYRRMLLDRYFAPDFPFGLLCRLTTTTPVFSIRTCKSPVAVGIPLDVVEQARQRDVNWCTNGTCGTIQFSHAGEYSKV